MVGLEVDSSGGEASRTPPVDVICRVGTVVRVVGQTHSPDGRMGMGALRNW